MCGIAGLLATAAGTPPEPAAVERMNASLLHRGPDEGSVERFGPCVLGSRRLRVIDLAPTGRQPVRNERGDIAAVFNGELYNFAELRADLETRGHQVPGTGDTQTLPHLYEEYGPGFVERIEGMFALALWDAGRPCVPFQSAVRLDLRVELNSQPLEPRSKVRVLEGAAEALEGSEESAARLTLAHRSPPA